MKRLLIALMTALLVLSIPAVALAHGGSSGRGHGDADLRARVELRGAMPLAAFDRVVIAPGQTILVRKKIVNRVVVNKLEGTILSINIPAQMITVRLQDIPATLAVNEARIVVRLKLVPGAKLERADIRVRLRDFAVGDEIEALLLRHTLQVFKLELDDD